MHLVTIKFSRLNPKAIIPAPSHGYREDAGADLRSVDTIWIGVGQTQSVATGLAVEIPAGVELQVRSRSGLALKHQVVVSNSPGTIDPGFRGELKVLLTNHGMEDFLVNEGDRIAQAIAAPYFGVNWVQEELSDSSRGEGGLGSTGVK